MKAHSPLQVIQSIDKAFFEGNVEELVTFYDDHAVQVDYIGVAGGGRFEGRDAIRDLYASFLQPGKAKVTHLKIDIVETDGIALFTSKWRVASEGAEPLTHIATVVLRRQADGSWKNLIDTGPAVLGE